MTFTEIFLFSVAVFLFGVPFLPLRTRCLISWFIVGGLVRIFFPAQVFGAYRLYRMGADDGFIIAGTHLGVFDHWIYTHTLPYWVYRDILPIRFVSKGKFTGKNAWILNFLTSKIIYPFYDMKALYDRGNGEKLSMEESLSYWVDAGKHGETVFIYPEGRSRRVDCRSHVKDFLPGVGYLHNVTGQPIVPASLSLVGERTFWGGKKCVLRFGTRMHTVGMTPEETAREVQREVEKLNAQEV